MNLKIQTMKNIYIAFALLFSVSINLKAQITAGIMATNVCHGTQTNFTDISTGGPNSWQWDFGDGNTSTLQNPTHFYSAPGFYNIQLIASQTDSAWSDTVFYNTTVYASPTVSTSSVNVTCNGGNDGSISASVSGGTAPYTYNWSHGPTTQNVVSLSAGTYTLDVVDMNGCWTSTSAVVTEPSAITMTTTVTDVSCFNGNDGNISIDVIGGAGGFQYTLDGEPGALLSDLYTGIYELIMYDANGCTVSDSIFISQPSEMVLTFSYNNETSDGACDGNATVNVSEGTAPYSYLWSNGFSNSFNDSLCANTYTVSVTDNNGCVMIENIAISTNANYNVNFTFNQTACLDSIFNFTDLSSYPNIFSWEWDFGNGNTSTLQNPSNNYTAAGTYPVTLVITDDVYGMDTLIMNVVVETCGGSPTYFVDFSYNYQSCIDSGYTFTASSDYPNIIAYAWDFGDGDTSSLQNPLKFYPDTGVYTVSLSITDAVYGVQSVSYNDIYVQNCINPADTCNIYFYATQSNITCFGLANGAAWLNASNGTEPYTYIWNNGFNLSYASNLGVGTYTATVTDVYGCTNSTSFTITQPDILSIAPNVTNATCGNNNGSISITISGGTGFGYSLVWGNGDSSYTRSNLTSGSYFITVFNGGCPRSLQIPVGDSDGPSVTVSSVVDANCGGADGEVYISVTGGATPYAYTWSNGITVQNLLNAQPGYVGVVVADANSCAGSASATIGSNGNTPPALNGKVTLTQNGFNVTGGKVQVVRENPYANAMVVVAETNIQPDGNYFINSVLPIGDYLLIARPDTSIPSLNYAIPTYFEITHKWEDATQIGAMCDMVITNDIEVINLLPLTGTSTIGGAIFADGLNKNFGRAGDPIPGIDISLEQIPGGIIANTQTNEEGEFKFDNVPVSSNKYTVYVAIPGLPMAESYIVEIGSDTVVNNLNFLVGENEIYIETISNIESKIAENNSLSVYPNPFKGQTNIVYEVVQSENVAVEIYNILGEKIHAQNFGVQPKGKYAYNFQNKDVQSGVMIVRLQIGNNIETIRMIAVE
jgi:PKD repeat protein